MKKIKRENGGGGWIRTIEGVASRFTVCPLWPLGNPTKKEITILTDNYNYSRGK